ncbi:MAG: DNA helicase UvrD, partial [Treponema sp.]|nr:DNA helicase UvrD [Treponema sp.]
MPVFKNLLGKSKISKTNKNSYDNPKLQEIFDLNNHLTNLLSSDSYIAKSSYLRKVDISRNTLAYFQELKDDNLLAEFCKKNKVSESTILSVIEKANDFKTLVSDHNQTFIEEKLKKEKSYLDSILKDIDPNIKLDEDQRKVVLTDEDYSLVIAGAGA